MEPNAGHSARSSMYFCWAWEGVMPWDGGREWIEGESGWRERKGRKIILIVCCFGVYLATSHRIVQLGASMHIQDKNKVTGTYMYYSNTIHSVLHIMFHSSWPHPMITNLIPIPRWVPGNGATYLLTCNCLHSSITDDLTVFFFTSHAALMRSSSVISGALNFLPNVPSPTLLLRGRVFWERGSKKRQQIIPQPGLSTLAIHWDGPWQALQFSSSVPRSSPGFHCLQHGKWQAGWEPWNEANLVVCFLR